MQGVTDYIIDEFDVSRKEAVQMLSLWMKNFNKEGNYDTIKKCLRLAKQCVKAKNNKEPVGRSK